MEATIISLILAKIGLTGETATLIFAALYAISEALSLIPAIKANGTVQLIFNILKKLAGKE